MITGIPVIDLFAGPGGLGDGFASAGFDVVLSCEMDSTACETLTIRKFFHLFEAGKVPEEYYQFCRGELSCEELEELFPTEFREARLRVLNVQLGDKSRRVEVHQRINESLNKTGKDTNFVLVGGPPCQAYSLAGRSRRIGLGKNHTRDKMNRRVSLEELPDGARELLQERTEKFYSDPKHRLYLEYLEIIAVHRPAVFVMENVKGITSAKRSGHGTKAELIFEKITQDLRAPGKAVTEELPSDIKSLFGFIDDTRYRLVSITEQEVNDLLGQPIADPRGFIARCEDFGVPQARHRVFIIGIREDLNGRPDTLRKSDKPVTVRDMLFKLPKLRSGLSKEEDTSSNWAAVIARECRQRLENDISDRLQLSELLSKIKKEAGKLTRGSDFYGCSEASLRPGKQAPEVLRWISDPRLNGVINHQSRSHMSSDLARYLFCSAYALSSNSKSSPKLEDWPAGKLLPNHQNVSEYVNKDGIRRVIAETNSDRFKVQVWDKPATTITSHISKDGHYYIHPDPVQCRSLTVREAARLQTFPDNYFFAGGRTAQYHQVGNAVPPYFAKQIAESIRAFLTTDIAGD